MRSRAFIALAGAGAAALFAVACDSPTMPQRAANDVFDFRLRTDSARVLRWETGRTIRIYVHPGNSASLGATLEQAVERGAAAWNAHAFFGEYEIVRVSTLDEADAVVRWSSDLSPVDESVCPPVFSNGVTTFCLEDPDQPSAGLTAFAPQPPHDASYDGVKFLVTILSSQATIPGRVDMLVAHELGHVLGIASHSPFDGDLMAAGVPLRATPGTRDISTVQVLYHTRADINP